MRTAGRERGRPVRVRDAAEAAYKTDGEFDPNRDARAQAFKNAEVWAKAIGDDACDAGHGCLGARGDKGAEFAKRALDQQRKKAEEAHLQSFDPKTWAPGGN